MTALVPGGAARRPSAPRTECRFKASEIGRSTFLNRVPGARLARDIAAPVVIVRLEPERAKIGA